jgi:hypothetical protein
MGLAECVYNILSWNASRKGHSGLKYPWVLINDSYLITYVIAVTNTDTPQKLNAKEHRDVFFIMPFFGEAMHIRNMEMSFLVCPLRNCECKAPKIGMNCN